jgi:esterase/lipase superfamily enzyme
VLSLQKKGTIIIVRRAGLIALLLLVLLPACKKEEPVVDMPGGEPEPSSAAALQPSPTQVETTTGQPKPSPRPAHSTALVTHGATIFDAGAQPCVDCTKVRVYFGTNRALTGDYSRASKVFGTSLSSMRYGYADVSIPPWTVHKVGRMEEPQIIKLELKWDPKRHVMLLHTTVLTRDAFFDRLHAATGRSNRELLVFVHGYNVRFVDAMRRTAQIAHDLQFDGIPVAYTWPSQGELTRAAYRADQRSADASVLHLKQFLVDLAQKTDATGIHLIAHSMGNRVLTNALAEIANDDAIASKPRFNEIALTAPDVDAQVMVRLARAIVPIGRRVTLYASSRDNALKFSRSENAAPRAGLGGDDILILTGVDSIDASAVDTELVGHFYYAENRSVLNDIFSLVHDGLSKSVGKRFGMRRVSRGAKEYWVFAP